MPRTKVSKNIKRNRDVATREEKLRQFDAAFDQEMEQLDEILKLETAELTEEFQNIKTRIPHHFLKMTMGDLMSLKIANFSEVQDITPQPAAAASSALQQSQINMSTSAKKSKDDEGYLTEDNSLSSAASGGSVAVFANLSLLRPIPNRGRTPGPLTSAKAKKPTTRRSKSACGGQLINTSSSALATTSGADHTSRSTLRTPMKAGRVKALSADRSTSNRAAPSSPAALLRWPKPGEAVVSMHGSPVVSQVVPEGYANVNIPIKNGVLSLRPKKLACVNPEIIQNIDPETLDQIKTLQSNLKLIMSYANRLDN